MCFGSVLVYILAAVLEKVLRRLGGGLERLGRGFGASWSVMGLSARPVGLGGPVWEPVWEADLSERLTCLGG